MSDVLSIGISALLAFQRGLVTTSHNISNASTEGYTRQRVDLGARAPTPAGRLFLGSGVQVQDIRRLYDEFVTGQVRTATAAHQELEEFHRLASQVSQLFAESSAGLAPALQGFFESVHGVASDPAGITARQVMLSQARSLADRLAYLDQRFSDQRQGVNTLIRNSVNEINALASGIAGLNRQIGLSRGAGDAVPNDLLDKRDHLIDQLSELVSVAAVPQDDGAINLFVGNGQTLVVGITASSLATMPNRYDPTRLEVGLSGGGTSIVLSDHLAGGKLGAALSFRRDVLDVSQNALGRIASAIAQTFNAQHRLGLDLYGDLGGDFFSMSAPAVSPSSGNGGAGTVSVTVSDATALTTSDYQVTYEGAGSWTVTRLSDGTGMAGPGPFAFDGLTFVPGGVPAVGDSFLVQPTRGAAGRIDVAVADPRRIAAAGPLRTAEAADASGTPTNIGTGRITAGEVNSATGLPLGADITLTFDPNAGGAGIPGFVVAGGPAGPLLYDPVTESGGKEFTLAGYGDFTFTLSGMPEAGDSFVIADNVGGVGAGDNRNALRLGALQTQGLLAGATYEGAYGQLVAEIGATTHKADVQRGAQESLLNQAKEARESVSGVNLDEEAANLLRFQQAYQAAAQVISVADSMFQELIAVMRR